MRKGAVESTVLRFDVDEDSDKTVAEQLRDALSKAAVRVVDLFRDWDDDKSGTVSRKELHKAMAEMQFDVPAGEIDALFDEWDPDGSGLLELKELEKLLRRGSPIKAAEVSHRPAVTDADLLSRNYSSEGHGEKISGARAGLQKT